MKLKPNGKKSKVVIGIDKNNFYCGKEKNLARSPGKVHIKAVVSMMYNMFKGGNSSITIIPLKSISRLETGLKNNRCFYICHNSSAAKGHRIAVEAFDPAASQEIIGRIQYIKKGKHS